MANCVLKEKSMKTVKTNKFTISVEVEVDGDAKQLMKTFASQMTSEDAFFDDFGYGVWGGYDGPYLVACTVRDEQGKVIAKHEERDKSLCEEI